MGLRSWYPPLNLTPSLRVGTIPWRECPRLNLALQRPFHTDPTCDCPRPAQPQRDLQEKSSDQPPEYPDVHEVHALIGAAASPRARLLFLIGLRAGHRISEALAVEARDLSLDSDRPTIRERQGKDGKARIAPVRAELHAALTSAIQFGNIGQLDRLIRASRPTADRWIKATARAEICAPYRRAVTYRTTPSGTATLATCWSTASRSTTSAGDWDPHRPRRR